MNREKQIDETAKALMNAINEKHGHTSMRGLAEALYNAGYRKQSEGEWEKRTFIVFDSEKVGFRCSECNTTWDTQTNYCPNCGAKMKGESK